MNFVVIVIKNDKHYMVGIIFSAIITVLVKLIIFKA